MTISYNWLKNYLKTELDLEALSRILTASGLEVEKVSLSESVKGGLKGVLVGEVLECIQHPNADRLRLTKVDVGNGEILSIVCGAPNVAAGQKVLVATIGATLYPSNGEPLIIKKGKIRGEESYGMICAEDELGIGESHDGILVLDPSIAIGTKASEHFNMHDDYIFEIGLTPNRTDAMSHYGVARDLYASIRNMEGLENRFVELSFPESNLPEKKSNLNLDVQVLDSEGAPRYSGLAISNIKIEPSPAWLQERLNAIGLKPINNVVDITNFVQHELGQPLHAFDADVIEGNKIIVRRAHAEEKFVTLDGIERTLHPDDLMICDAQKAMCIAGVFGGKNSGVSNSTVSIFLESAYFNPVSIRKTARRHGLNTDASFRFERGADPNMAIKALYRAAQLIAEVSGGLVASSVIDLYPTPISNHNITLRWEYVSRLIGKKLPNDRITSILQDLGIGVIKQDSNSVQLSVPPFKTDVTRESDLVEEILRIYGYDHIEMPAQLRSSLSFVPSVDPEKIQNKVADLLSSLGFSEMIGMSMVKEKYSANDSDVVKLLNPLSSDLGVMRNNMLYTSLEAIALNQNHKSSDLRLFEFGKTYHLKEGNYQERRHLTVFLTGRALPENWNNNSKSIGFPELLGVTENLFKLLGIRIQMSEPSEGKVTFSSGKQKLGIAGFVNNEMLDTFDIRSETWYADIDWDSTLKILDISHISYESPAKYPAVRRDLSLLLDESVSFASLEKIAYESERKLLKKVGLFDVYQGDKLEKGKKSYALSFILQDASKTLTDEVVEKTMSKIAGNFNEKLGAMIRQ
ncbi:MAG: phenylalanine--tRNA ligase subunit beta [Flavobacteriales bacterium]|nr:phenylalanine--tRNA ligase subunit beta [Flavobacteriales bacterium]